MLCWCRLYVGREAAVFVGAVKTRWMLGDSSRWDVRTAGGGGGAVQTELWEASRGAETSLSREMDSKRRGNKKKEYDCNNRCKWRRRGM